MKRFISIITAVCCLSAVSVAQPANDNCTGAIALTASSSCTFSTYSNVGATPTTSPTVPPAPGCGNYLGGDVWFSVTVPASGHLIFDTQTPSGGLTDIAMAIYSGDCTTGLTLIECDDDDSDNGYYMPKIDRIGLAPGTTIYIRVWEYGNNSFGNFNFCVYEPLGTGPCASVPTILCGQTQTLNFQGGGDWNNQYCGNAAPGEEAIFAYTPTQNTGTFLTLSGNPSAEYINFAYNTSCTSTGWTCIGRTAASSATFGPLALDSGVTYYFICDNEDASSNITNVSFYINCPEIPGYYEHPTEGIQGTYNGACMVNTCSGTYVDDGNANPYSPNINEIYRTFCPEFPGKCMTATINSLVIESSSGCVNDALIIRDGPTQGSPFLWGGCGNWSASLPLTITSTNSSGCLTFVFYSNAITNLDGWNITLGCVNCSQVSQTNNDCNTAIPICGATNLNSSSPGPGLTSTCGGCNLSENFSSWYYFEITADGKLALDMKPEEFFEDYDFALYEADTCATLGDPVRCSYAMSPTYCRQSYAGGFSTGIYNVVFNTISNNSNGLTSGHYANYTSLSTTVNAGSSYNLTVNVIGATGAQTWKQAYVRAWFDWNKNLVFDAGEIFDLGGATVSPQNLTLSIPIPLTARPGKTAFRVFSQYASYQANPCAATPTGEAETYAIFISDGTHCSNNVKDADETGVDCGGADCVDCSKSSWPTNTGMNGTSTDYSEDVSGDSWVNWQSVTAGQRYYILINNWSPGANGFDLVWQFAEGGAMDCAIVLPVELLSFDAICNDGLVDIAWEVASETNNDYFVVLKSYNGIAFAAVDTIDGRGNANSYMKYETSYLEENPGTVYYKLKQIDLDGAFAYSEPIVANCGADTRTFKAVPNPATQGENWKIEGMVSGDEMRIFDIYGREHYKENLEKGMYTIVINGEPATKLIVY
ncbi:MAG: hypothetical protein A2W93_06200 [Bacteroidetes bacterium GWF2_43_63]|nr:MAG: hypothetical protein A2W94_08335 [Bacteroidetes bacterium GWE2_42_42]OFY53212.1 MAG: hypothetical protein A2W93_06200 [Bacteroidetes bacterium GWF2_43_63]HBG71796.1 hypothetical protein [Bacteroidales bacterium]HCB61539.1 hypothetical protein [Bacteroidales bacterium]HCY22751.1 hypothetical protein [Bacteroidales bacterium]